MTDRVGEGQAGPSAPKPEMLEKAAALLGESMHPAGCPPICRQSRVALALEEAAREERDLQTRVRRGAMDAMERARPLCPDHRDKQRAEVCLACKAGASEAALAVVQAALRSEHGLRVVLEDKLATMTKERDEYKRGGDFVAKTLGDALESSRAEATKAERERIERIANSALQAESLSHVRARDGGRWLVAECRAAGAEVAQRILAAIRAPRPPCACPKPCEVHPHDPDTCPNCLPSSPPPPSEEPRWWASMKHKRFWQTLDARLGRPRSREVFDRLPQIACEIEIAIDAILLLGEDRR